MQLSNHAVIQMQQRAISESTIDFLLKWGKREYDHRGAVVRYFDKHSRSKMLKHLGEESEKKFEKQLDTYLVMTPEGRIITVGHRYRRINRT